MLHKSKADLKINISNILYLKRTLKDWLSLEIQILKDNVKILLSLFNQTNILVLYLDKMKLMGLQDSVVLYKSYDYDLFLLNF